MVPATAATRAAAPAPPIAATGRSGAASCRNRLVPRSGIQSGARVARRSSISGPSRGFILGLCNPPIGSCGRPPRPRGVETRAAGLAELSASSIMDFAFPQDVGAAAFGVVGAAVLVKTIDLLKKNGVMDQTLSRKLVHILSGPGFVASWALFSAQPGARFVAIAAPVLNLFRLVAIGSGQLRNDDAVRSISRSGDKKELLRGPLFYVIVLIVCTLFFWRESPTGIVALSMMCGGDGLADVVGRRWGKGNQLPYNPDKSYAGSVAMFLGGFGMSLAFLAGFSSLGYMSTTLPVGAVAAICLAATVVESLPLSSSLDDNVTVPATALLLGWQLL